jgi:hypothetical protein
LSKTNGYCRISLKNTMVRWWWLVTESGILAAAHLGGAGSVKRYFKNNGEKYIKDAYGTSIRSYMEAFGGYDTSSIVANVNAVASLN